MARTNQTKERTSFRALQRIAAYEYRISQHGTFNNQMVQVADIEGIIRIARTTLQEIESKRTSR